MTTPADQYDPSTPIRVFFEQVYRPLRLLDASAAAIQQYQVAIARFDAFLGREALLSDLNELRLSEFMAEHLIKKLSPVTANNRARMLMTLWRFARRKRVPLDDSLLDWRKLKEPKRRPEAWTFEQMERLIQSCRLARGRIAGIPAGKYWPALVLLIYDTGLRRAAAFAARFEEIDFANKFLRVPAERMKNCVEQYFRLHDQTLAAILDTLPPRRAKVFPWPFVHQRSLYDRFRTILRRAGLPYTKRDLFHRLRRTTASHITRLVGEQQASLQMGHQDASTIKRYVDPRFTAQHDLALILPRPDWQEPVKVEVRPEPAPVEPRPVLYRPTPEDLAGRGDDVFARLMDKTTITPEDLRDVIGALGMHHKDFAGDLGVTPQYLSGVLRRHFPLGDKLQKRIRSTLGLTYEHKVYFQAKAKGGAA